MSGVALPGHKLTRTVCGGGLGAPAAKANPSEGALSRAHCEALRVANGGAWALRRPCLGRAAASTGQCSGAANLGGNSPDRGLGPFGSAVEGFT